MVGFGKKLREDRIPEWKQYYINYKLMKGKLKTYMERLQDGASESEKEALRKQFTRMLDCQIEKIVLFLIEQQGHLAARLSALGAERELAKDSGDDARIAACVDAYRSVGMQLLDLLHYVETNAIGIRKILKKFDKRASHRLTDYYVASRSNHPYSQLQQVFRHVGIGAMVGALTRSLAELRNQTRSLYDEPGSSFLLEDPVISSIKVAQERLTDSTNFLKFVAKQLLDKEEERPRDEDDFVTKQYHFMSLLLNLGNTFLYMVNTYIVVPTADKYAQSLGAAPTLCGVIIGSMAVAQLVSSVYFSAWSNTSYNHPLIFSSIVLLVGNLLYAVAYDLGSLPLLLLGRIFCGLGSARAVNRRYISDWVPTKTRLKASAGFVSASALGMAVGPALAAVFEVEITYLGFTFNANTLPGWVMAGAWLIYIIWLLICFKEPLRMPSNLCTSSNVKPKLNPATITTLDNANGYVGVLLDKGALITQPLLDPVTRSVGQDIGDCEDVGAESTDEKDESNKPATSISEAYSLLTTPVKVQLFIYFMLKYAMEIVLSESSVVTSYYFDWTTRAVAGFLGLLGLTVLPVNYLVGSYISNIFEDRQILFASEFITCLGLAISFAGPIPYTVVQYVTGSLITFVAAEVLEGVNLSLLSKVMSSRLSRGTYNNGLLSTEAGTLARVVADATITLAGYLGTRYLLNVTLAPTLLIGLVSLILTSYSYNSLF